MDVFKDAIYECKENLIQFDSCIFNAPINEVWKVISNWKRFEKYSDFIPKYKHGSEEFLTIGSKFIVEDSDDSNHKCLMEVKEVSINESRIKYSLKCYVLENFDYKLEFNLININNVRCYLDFKHIFNNSIGSCYRNKISSGKQRILFLLKERFLNKAKML
jgi:hypothetical protein